LSPLQRVTQTPKASLISLKTASASFS
jgi:hypothetical protein